MNGPAILPHVDLGVLAVPPRSRLTRLLPRGRGTQLVESLTSLVSRLAAVHQLPTGVLILRVLNRAPTIAKAADVLRAASLANGVSRQAADWAEWVGTASATDVEACCLRPWAAVLPPLQLVDGYMRHCPDCLAEWADDGVVYEPLLWAMPLARWCPTHKRPLEENCPRCQRAQRAIGYRSRVGVCRHCGAWLGTRRRPLSRASAWDRWLSSQLAELTVGPSNTPQPRHVQKAVRTAIARVDGTQAEVAEQIGVAESSLSKWQSGNGRA